MKNFFDSCWRKIEKVALFLLYKPTTKPQNHEQHYGRSISNQTTFTQWRIYRLQSQNIWYCKQ